MNKLVIVGNGFDMAHGLPTSYKNFIDDFWRDLKNSFQNEFIKKFIYFSPEYTGVFDYKTVLSFADFQNNLIKYSDEYTYEYDDTRHECYTSGSRFKTIFKFENRFFKQITIKTLENWVDIENEYYKQLKKISKRKLSSYSGNKEIADEKQVAKNKQEALKLNKEFTEVIELFEIYLTQKVHQKYDFNKQPHEADSLLSIFEVNHLGLKESSTSRHPYQLEFLEEDQEDLILFDGVLKALPKHNINNKTWFLNFNNTQTLDKYLQMMNGNHDLNYYGDSKQIQVHGRLGNKKDNQINFGFGDEMDEDYQLIENLDDNDFLKYFKSFKYSQNSNYKNLLDFVDDQKFQVYIMGHSCGLSDRTLLNTIFEHENCRSIKVFYHKRENGSDNFTEIIQNISRHFKDKKLMRSKIVNKSLCKPLPQDIRFQEKK